MKEVNLLVLIEVQPGKRDLQIEAFEQLKGRRAELFRGSAACHTCHVDPDEYRARVISFGPSM